MPFYEFQCSEGVVTEKLVSVGTKSITCPHCKKRAKKIMSPCSFKLVGGGWYADGYSSSKSGSTGSKSKTSDSSSKSTAKKD
jgi:putative FmdB family regulatory protein